VLISGCSAAYWGGLSEDPKFQVQGQTAIGPEGLSRGGEVLKRLCRLIVFTCLKNCANCPHLLKDINSALSGQSL